MIFFPAFFDHPKRIRFTQQESDERIELFLRQHWAVNIPWILTGSAMFLAPSLVVFSDQYLQLNLITMIPIDVLVGSAILWYLLVVAYIVEAFLHWYFNIYIVTNKHLVDINFHNLLNRDKIEVRINDVQSAKSSFKGILGSFFRFGDVIIETAAENQRLEFHRVPHPDLVADRIQDIQAKVEGGRDGV
ncbi:MAG: PH domain-containing protein [Candidatus Daviesbacteria bacterium]|nr:PH domain-containing protein [Candidatus Daviesbacteria bacterium]